MEYLSWIWLGVFLILLLIEGLSLALVSIWFSIGALLAMFVALLGGPWWLQLIVFVFVSAVLLAFVFPLARKRLKVGQAKTNVDSLIGKEVLISKEIHFNQIGEVNIHGVHWSATGEGSFQVGERVRISSIEGNKVIVEKLTVGGNVC